MKNLLPAIAVGVPGAAGAIAKYGFGLYAAKTVAGTTILGSTLAGSSAAGTIGFLAGTTGAVGVAGAILLSPAVIVPSVVGAAALAARALAKS